MIVSTRGKLVRHVLSGRPGKGFPREIFRRAEIVLAALAAAETLDDLRWPPGNMLERLSGDRAGQCSVRINRQWRYCFVWTPNGPAEVELTDYH